MRARLLFGLLGCAAVLHGDPGTDLNRSLALVRRIEAERIDLASRLAPAVCAVFRGRGGGSGVLITEDGLLLSNFHVAELSNEMRVGLSDQRIHPAAVLGVDPSGDLALLRMKEDRPWPHAPLGDSDALEQGDWVYAMGNPFLLATDFTPTITLGVVSGIHRYQPGSIRGTLLYPDCIQTDASINPGNSGGPLFNFAGEMVGINGRVSLRGRGRVNIGVGYAISSNQIKLCLPELRAGLVVEHGTLNATVRSVDDFDWPGGVRVTFDRLLAPGCAYDAGIMVGDALLEFEGVKIDGVNQFSRLIAVLPKGRRVSLKVARYEKETWSPLSFSVVLDGIPLLRGSQLKAKHVPHTYIEHEIDRTFEAARAAIAPIETEERAGRLIVRGRDPVALTERYSPGTVALQFGTHSRTATAKGGIDDGKPIGEERRRDMLERVEAVNDMVRQKAREGFAKVVFTGGALVSGHTADRFEVETKAGDKRVYFIELSTGRLLRVDLYARSWVRWISLLYSDWRLAGGLLRPYKTTIWDRDKRSLLQTIEYDSIRKG